MRHLNVAKILSTTLLTSALLAASACGGGSKKAATSPSGGSGDEAAAAPSKSGGNASAAPPRAISKDARNDFDSAAKYFADQEKAGWSSGSCKDAAGKFSSVVSDHKDLVEAQYMVGLSYQRCGMLNDAANAYNAALKIKPTHAQSMSNLGEIAYEQGKLDQAKAQWKKAIDAYGKLVAARTSLASLALDEMRKTKDAAAWGKLEEDARGNLSAALAVDNDNIKAYTLYALVYMEGRQKNKNRLDLAKLLLDEAKKRNDNFAPLKNAFGLYYLYRGNLSLALEQFQAAVTLDPKFVEARMNVGMTTLGFRKWDVAKDQFNKVLELNPKNYDAMIGLGVALRGLKDFDGAEAQYKKAAALDPKRGEAIFNLGVLYKDFRASKQADMRASQATYRTARDYFKDFLTKSDIGDDDKTEAKNNIADCEKVVTQLDEAIKNQAANPPPPPAAKPGAAAAAAPAAAPATAPAAAPAK